ncbi:hypothetical protein WJR50_00785 [Catalinimonas sp. 4WD22]|uniref:hypothetical protein n=1 Tax=Catalinimonas locisalis TaxID=3133978 RepID=UPI00310136AB
MAGKYTQIYREEYENIQQIERSILKDMLLNKEVYQLHQDIIEEYNLHRFHIIKELECEGYTSEGKPRKSWFRRELFRKFQKYKNPDFDYELERFIEGPFKDIKESFHQKHQDANASTRTTHYFDYEYVKKASPEDIAKLLGAYNAYYDLKDNLSDLTHQLLEEIETEKKLVKFNSFNALSPTDMLDYFILLTQLNPRDKNPFLKEKIVYKLVNMICSGDDTEPVKLNLFPGQEQIIKSFIYCFYRFCKDNHKLKKSQDKEDYAEILTRYTQNFRKKKVANISTNFNKDFSTESFEFPDHYLKWLNNKD